MWILPLLFIVSASPDYTRLETRAAQERFASLADCNARAAWWLEHDDQRISRGQALLGGGPGLCAPASPLVG